MLIEAIKKRYTGTTSNEEIRDLCVDSMKVKEITQEDAAVLQTLPNLRSMSCIMTSLTSIGNLPALPITKLFLQDNRLSGASGLFAISRCPRLKELRLGGNRVKDFTELEFLGSLPNLEILELEMNPVASLPNYRQVLFEKLPNLKIVDGLDREGQEREDEEEGSESDSEMGGSDDENLTDDDDENADIDGELDDEDDEGSDEDDEEDDDDDNEEAEENENEEVRLAKKLPAADEDGDVEL